MLKHDVINMVEQLTYTQLQKVSDYINILFSKVDNCDDEADIDDEQRKLLDLLNYTIDSGRQDFAENHDFYIYGNR